LLYDVYYCFCTVRTNKCNNNNNNNNNNEQIIFYGELHSRTHSYSQIDYNSKSEGVGLRVRAERRVNL
jgi:hypothetical protein